MRRFVHGFVRWIRKTAFSESVMMVFSAALTLASIYQFIILRNQLDVMRKDQRAWVTAITGRPQTSPSGGGTLLKIPVELKNTGKTPARDVRVEVIVRIIKNGDLPHCEYGSEIPSVRTANRVFNPNVPHSVTGVVFSSITDRSGAKPAEISRDEIQQLTDGREFFVIYGKVGYLDTFNQKHWEHFCSWGTLGKPVMLTSSSCMSYNEIDSD